MTRLLACLAVCAALFVSAHAAPPAVSRTLEVGTTGFAAMRPVMAAACPHACPWGELGDFLKDAAKPFGYDIVLCRNCNRAEGPRIVAKAALPPALTPLDLYIGTNERVNAKVDFGVTEAGLLAAAYDGVVPYAADGPFKNLRLIAKIEDPTYLLVAVKTSSGITDLSQIAAKHLPVHILAAGALANAVLAHYGLTGEALAKWGGSIGFAMGATRDAAFDVIVSDLGSSANNPESNFWTSLSQAQDLTFLQLPPALLDELARMPGAVRVTARWGLLRGVDRMIDTVGRSGEAFFARDDMPEQAGYDLAKAIDQSRANLKWYVRPYSYDPNTVWTDQDVPLHPGAARYYREKGYLR